jgi:hypothetical protein
MKTVVIVSDLHCGSTYGITPPSEFKSSHNRDIQEEAWNEYVRMTQQWARPDVLICNGDAIEGNQSLQGGAELITPDRSVQCDMAITALEAWQARKIFMTYGTAYHVGKDAEDFERGIATALGAEIEGHLYLRVEGLTFDIRHKVGTSAVPHGRATALLREMLWALVKEAGDTGPKVDVVIRSHAHYSIVVKQPGKLAVITPGLQLARGRFGARECTGEIHWGAVRLTVDRGKIIQEDYDICKLAANKPRIFKVK